MVDKAHIMNLLDIHFVIGSGEPWEQAIHILDDGSVDVDGDVILKRPAGGRIPVSFNIVNGFFKAENMSLFTMENIPNSCTSLYLFNNRLTTLNGCPSYLVDLDVSMNQLTNFKGGPELVDNVEAYGNLFTSFEGLPEKNVEYSISITYKQDLPLLRLLNAQRIHVGTPGAGYSRHRPFEPVNKILNTYAGQGHAGALACAAELADAGYKANAQW